MKSALLPAATVPIPSSRSTAAAVNYDSVLLQATRNGGG
jgi:hypothetical protein